MRIMMTSKMSVLIRYAKGVTLQSPASRSARWALELNRVAVLLVAGVYCLPARAVSMLLGMQKRVGSE